MNSIQKAQTIGAGGFGKIRVYYSQQFKRKVIEKTIKPNFFRLRDENSIRLSTFLLNCNNYINIERSLKKESAFMMLMKLVKLDCCVEILGFAYNPFRIIMEYCEGGDLRMVLDQYNVPVQDKIIIILQILAAIKNIHQLKVIHGDLKCKNIFLANKYVPGNYSNIKIKIGDFGLSEVGGKLIIGGTPGFAAPESFRTGGSFESDIYSVGKIMLEIMTQLPVETISAINISNINSIKNRLPKFLNVTTIYNIVIPCLYTDPKKRPTADKLYALFYFLFKSIIDVLLKVLNKTISG
jgi:serine/threonine protein kinase